MAPAGTPDAVIERLSSALRAALAQSDLQAALRARGVEVKAASQAEFSRFIADEQKRWSSTVEKAGIRLE